jgi:amidase
VERTRPPSVEQGHDLWLKLFSQTSVLQLRNVYQGHENLAGPFVRWRLETANKSSPLSLDEYIQTWMERDRLRETLLRWMETVPLIVCPVGATNAWPHDTLKCEVGGMTIGAFRAFSYAQTFNVFDLPSVSIPVTRSSDGLPIGVQVVGPPAGEHLVLAAARILEKELKESFTPADNSN